MTNTYPVYFEINSKFYKIAIEKLQRSSQNDITAIKKPLSKGRQDGSNTPETSVIDLKIIGDMFTINGKMYSQDIDVEPNGTELTQISPINAGIALFNAYKKQKGPFVLHYRGLSYNGLITDLSYSEDSSMSQSAIVNSTMFNNSPSHIDVTIKFLVGNIR